MQTFHFCPGPRTWYFSWVFSVVTLVYNFLSPNDEISENDITLPLKKSPSRDQLFHAIPVDLSLLFYLTFLIYFSRLLFYFYISYLSGTLFKSLIVVKFHVLVSRQKIYTKTTYLDFSPVHYEATIMVSAAVQFEKQTQQDTRGSFREVNMLKN